MVFTAFRNVGQVRVPVVSATLIYENKIITEPELYFAIDTAAEFTIITPGTEARLKLDAPDIDWENRFRHGGRKIETIMGEAVFKTLAPSQDWLNRNGDAVRSGASMPIGLMFFAEDGKSTWRMSLETILFCDETLRGHSRIIPGRQLEFCLLGQDVLKRCGLISTLDHGLLTPDKAQVDQAIEKLIRKTKQS